MRSESEVNWVRAKNNVGQRTVATDWHAIVPGLGSLDVPPGTVCGTGLTGSLQTVQHTSIKTLDGKQHELCVALVDDWLADLAGASPGPFREADPRPVYDPPKDKMTEPVIPTRRLQ